MYELLRRERAYNGLYLSAENIASRAAMTSCYKLRPSLPAMWPAECKSLCERCWNNSPDARPEFKDIRDELAAWRNDPTLAMLKEIVKGSTKGLLEIVGFDKKMLRTAFSDAAAKASNGSRRPLGPLRSRWSH
jgi:hypothetical protein